MENQTTQEIQQYHTEINNQEYTTYLNYTTNRLSCTPPEQKVIPGTGPQAQPPTPPQNYYQIPLMYNNGTPENRILNDFLIEGCEMKTDIGVQSKPSIGNPTRLDHSVMVKFDENNQEQGDFIKCMEAVYEGCGYILHQYKGNVKIPHFNTSMAVATGFKGLVYRPIDEVTSQPIQGRAPSMYFKLFSRGKAPFVEQTLFTGLDGKPISWTLLQGVEMKFIPLLHIKRVYIGGGKASIQMDMMSAIVTDIKQRGSTTRQTNTLAQLNQNRPQLLDTVSAQIARLTTDRQDQLVGASSPVAGGAPEQQPTNQPTFAGISGAKPSVAGVLPTIPTLPTLHDVMQSTPQRLPTIPTANTLQFS
jgi:hypothetical protein